MSPKSIETNSLERQDVEGLTSVWRRWNLRGYLKAVWERRQFAAHMPIEQLRAQHMNTVLGNLWHLLNPILLTAVYYLIFGVVLDITRGGIENFVSFLTIGVFTFHYTQKSVISGAKSVSSNEGLIRSLVFPRAILPFGAVIGQTVALVPAIVVMLAVALVTGVRPDVTWLGLLPMFALQAVFNLGGGLLLARPTYHFRDIENMFPYVFRLAFYGSGVLYPVSRFVEEGPLRIIFDLNPLFGFVAIARWLIMGSESGEEMRGMLIGSVVGWTVIGLVIGFMVFTRGEQEFSRG